MCYCPTPTLHLNLALTGDGAFLFSLKKTHSVWFISVLNYGDTENVLINHLLLVIPMLYPCHYTNLCPHKPHKHAHTHTHTHTQGISYKAIQSPFLTFDFSSLIPLCKMKSNSLLGESLEVRSVCHYGLCTVEHILQIFAICLIIIKIKFIYISLYMVYVYPYTSRANPLMQSISGMKAV